MTRIPGDTSVRARASWCPDPWYRTAAPTPAPVLRAPWNKGVPRDPDVRGQAPASALKCGPVSPEVVLLQVAARFGIAPELLAGRSREARVCRVRMIAMAEARHHGFSYPAIAAAFGRNHTTVMHACRVVGGGARAAMNALDVINAALDVALDERVNAHQARKRGEIEVPEYLERLRGAREVEDALEPLRRARGADGSRALEVVMREAAA